MKLLAALFAFLRVLFGKSDSEKLGSAEEKVKIYESATKIKNEIKKIETPDSKKLDDILRSGKLCILFLLFFTCCTKTVVPFCQDVKVWSDEDQTQMANELSTLSLSSPIRAALSDYKKMRDEARMCAETYEK